MKVTNEKVIKIKEHDAIILYDLINFIFWSKKNKILISDFFMDLEFASGLPRDYTKKNYRRLKKKFERIIPYKYLKKGRWNYEW